MKVYPNAKINIGHNILGWRDDGYHEIQSVYYPVGLKDELELSENTASDDRFVMTYSGFEIPCPTEDNLCWFAHYLVSQDYKIPNLWAHLHKNIPIGSGLGGSSSDAAFFIRALNDEFRLGMAWGEVHHYARQLAADCSFFASNRPAFAEGRGDQYESLLLDLSEYYIVIVSPAITIRTEDAYRNSASGETLRSLEEDVHLPVDQWKNYIRNDFETYVFGIHPELRQIKEKLCAAGALYASLNGKGPAVYGLFTAPTALRADFPGCFVYENKM